MLDPHLVEQIATALATDPGLVEKEWHVVRALRTIAALDRGDVSPVFSGGTSLSVCWGIIKRFSEDIDFKVGMPAAPNSSEARKQRREYREKVLAALSAADLRLIEDPLSRDGSNFFSAKLAYPALFNPAPGLRPYVQVEMTFDAPTLPAIERPIRSLIARAQELAPEVADFPCVDPIEIAADKLSALAWRVCTRDRSSAKDDPTVVRHMHDLAALESHVMSATGFAPLLKQTATADTGRGRGKAPADVGQRLAEMLERLSSDPLWAREYETFVHDKSFAKPDERISFGTELAATRRLTMHVGETSVPEAASAISE
jgi:hypothetical protein